MSKKEIIRKAFIRTFPVMAALQVWKRSTILRIVCGTVLYMILIQTVFV